jgi:cell division initiation protein
MRITPLDIQQKTFPTKFRGFDMEEVDSFLEVIREELEELLRENASVKEQLSRADSQLNEYNNMNATLRETLIREAETRADEIVKAAQERAVKIHEDIVELKGIRRHFKEEVKRLIESHMKMIDFDKEREEAQ